jgi:uncharacterized DUF497 family protein
MDFEFDKPKDWANRDKHGVSLAEAAEFDWLSVLARRDNRRDYGERREIGYGLIGRRLFCVVFVRVNPDPCRIISLRKANSREVRAYEEIRDRQADAS